MSIFVSSQIYFNIKRGLFVSASKQLTHTSEKSTMFIRLKIGAICENAGNFTKQMRAEILCFDMFINDRL